MEYGSYMAKGGKIQMALDHIDKWMPDDFELQKEYYQLINDKDQKGMEQFLDMYADQDRLMRYGIQYEDLGKLSEAIISGSEYAKGGKTSGIKDYLETLESDQIFDLCNDFYYDDEEWHEIKNDLDKDDLIQWAYDYCKKNKISLKDLKDVLGDREDEIADMKKMLQSNLIPYLDIAGKNPGVINLRVYNKDSFAFYNKNDNCKVAINYNYDSKSVIMYQEWDNGNMDDDEVSLSTFENYLSNTKMADGGPIKTVIKKKMFDINDDEISEDIFEWALENVPEEFEFEEDEEESFRNSDFEDVIDEINSRLNDYELLVDYEEDRIYVNIYKKEKMAKGGQTSDIYVLGSNYEIQRPGIDDSDLAKALKKYKVQMYFIDSDGWVELIGEKNDIENLLKDPNVWSISPNELDDLYLSKMKKYKGNLATDYNPSKYMKQYYKDLYSDEDYAKGGKLPNPDNLYALMELDEKLGYGSLVDGRVYTAQGAREKKYDLEDNNLVKEGSKIKIFSVSELLRRKSLPKQSKETVLRNYQDTEKMINSLSERFKDYEWKVDFKAKGGMLNDEMQTKKLAKQFEGKDLYDDEIVDEYTVKQFDSREDDDVIERWKMSKKKKFYVVPFDAQDDSFYYILVPKMKMEDGGYMAKGGKTKTNPAKFRDKVNAITKKLAGTKVPKKYKKDYGVTYDKKEANTAAKRIAGAKLAEVRAKLAKKKK